MNPGKALRLNSIFRKADRRSVIVAVDHGGIAGPIEGILKPAPLVRACLEGGADASPGASRPWAADSRRR
jgi:DhnA family fructose-bisphosphate aldolase class Ia